MGSGAANIIRATILSSASSVSTLSCFGLISLCQICHDYNTGAGVFGHCQQGLNCKRLHICEKHLYQGGSCSRNHNFAAPHTLSLLQGVPRDFSLKSVYANKQALRYYDIHINKAKSGNPNLRGNRGRGGRRRGRVYTPTVNTYARADVNKLVDCDVQEEGRSDDEQQPEEGAVAATKVGEKSSEGLHLVVMPQPPAKHQQPSEGGVATLSVGDNHQQLPQTRPAENSGAPLQLQCASSVGRTPICPTSPLIQGASATDVVSAAAEAGPPPIPPQTTSATTEGTRDIGSTHQPVQGASATGDTTAAVSGTAGENNSSNSLKTQQILIGKIIPRGMYRHIQNLLISFLDFFFFQIKPRYAKTSSRDFVNMMVSQKNRLKLVGYCFLFVFFLMVLI